MFGVTIIYVTVNVLPSFSADRIYFVSFLLVLNFS